MKLQVRHSRIVAALAAVLLGLAGTARAQFTAPPPGFTPADVPVSGNTLWHSLGIPQGFRKIEDATVNANGNNPEDERVPPLKRIGDPANAQSQNPAIKKAAEIKQEEDQKQQKIKAIKYLATIGCCSYKGVIDALSDALEDPTEEVRFEAAQAIVDLVCYNSAPCVDKPDEGDPCEHHPFKHDDDGPPGCLKKCLDKLKHCAHLDKKEEKHKPVPTQEGVRGSQVWLRRQRRHRLRMQQVRWLLQRRADQETIRAGVRPRRQGLLARAVDASPGHGKESPLLLLPRPRPRRPDP